MLFCCCFNHGPQREPSLLWMWGRDKSLIREKLGLAGRGTGSLEVRACTLLLVSWMVSIRRVGLNAFHWDFTAMLWTVTSVFMFWCDSPYLVAWVTPYTEDVCTIFYWMYFCNNQTKYRPYAYMFPLSTAHMLCMWRLLSLFFVFWSVSLFVTALWSVAGFVSCLSARPSAGSLRVRSDLNPLFPLS